MGVGFCLVHASEDYFWVCPLLQDGQKVYFQQHFDFLKEETCIWWQQLWWQQPSAKPCFLDIRVGSADIVLMFRPHWEKGNLLNHIQCQSRPISYSNYSNYSNYLQIRKVEARLGKLAKIRKVQINQESSSKRLGEKKVLT